MYLIHEWHLKPVVFAAKKAEVQYTNMILY